LDIYKERHINQFIPFFNDTIREIDEIHFVSNLGKQYFLKHYDYNQNENKLKVSYLGVPEVSPKKFSMEPGVLRIISVCYIYPLKRLDLLVEALALIKDFKVEWHHIGSYYKAHTEQIKIKANLLFNQNSNVTVNWLGDFSAAKVYDYYTKNSFDLFVSTSSSEGIPVSMMECMSFGIPVMSTNVGGVFEIVEHNSNGILLSENPTAKEIADELVRFYQLSEEQRITLSQAAYQTWKTKFNAIENYNNFANNLLNYRL
jgi:glycosyltransferase involved in cell wall biosynthesis